MKKVLIPTDFSENAGDAFAYALELLKKETAEIHIVHIIPPALGQENDLIFAASIMSKAIEAAEENMAAIKAFGLNYFDSLGSNLVLKTHVNLGAVIPGIKRMAKKLEVDLIIMGTQGANHSTYAKIFGTVSTSILKKMSCPIILIPKEYKYKNIDNAVFTTALAPRDPFELWKAIEVLSPHKPLVRCLFVKNKHQKIKTKKMETFARYIVENSPTIRTVFNVEIAENKDAIKVVNDYVATYDAELIVMHKTNKSVLVGLFTVSFTKKMVNSLTVPLLVMN